jgi:hypothetical protein
MALFELFNFATRAVTCGIECVTNRGGLRQQPAKPVVVPAALLLLLHAPAMHAGLYLC